MKRSAIALPLLFTCITGSSPAQSNAISELANEGRFWRSQFGIERYEMDLDPDGDGQTSREEYYAGTDPLDPASRLRIDISQVGSIVLLDWQSLPDARYQMLESGDLDLFSPLGSPAVGDGTPLQTSIDLAPPQGTPDSRQFYSLGVVAPLDRDLDGLSDREEAILGTNPDLKNTDGDSFEDGTEVFSTFTDPTVFDPAGGTIRGTLRLVDSLTATFESGNPLSGKTVFIDSDFDGQLGETERRTTTDANGLYEFLDLPPGLYEVRQILEPGETQTLPAEQTPQLPDRLPDAFTYTHPESGAAFDEPYGYKPVDVWPGAERFNVFPRSPEPVDPALILLPIGVRGENPPIGSYPTSEHLSLPETAIATVSFDETIIDLEGPDFIYAIPTQGANGSSSEPALLAFGPSENELIEFQILDQLSINEIDLADYPDVPFVKFIRITSETSGTIMTQNSDGGFGLVGFEALNFLPLNSEARRIRIVGTEVFDNENFARFFQDLPPSLILSAESGQPQVDQPFTFRFIPTDDLGIASLSATANGAPVALDAENTATGHPRVPWRNSGHSHRHRHRRPDHRRQLDLLRAR